MLNVFATTFGTIYKFNSERPLLRVFGFEIKNYRVSNYLTIGSLALVFFLLLFFLLAL